MSYGYIAWGLTIMLFAAIPMRADSHTLGLLGFLLVLFDCIMTFAGSTAYDAAFNTWTTDVTDDTNRGKVNTVLSVLPVFATVIVFIGLGSLYKPTNESNWLFFIVLGIIPIVAGILAIFMMKDSTHIVKNQNPDFLKETFYGFRKQVIKDNRMLYVCLATSCILGISQQTFFSYLINFVQNTLELGDNFVVPLAVVIIGAAVFTGVMGVLFDKLGRKHFYLPLLTVIVACTLIVYLMEFMPKAAWLPVLYVAGIFMLGSILSLSAALMASFQDYIPTGTEGRFQGVRMCFNVLLPMIRPVDHAYYRAFGRRYVGGRLHAAVQNLPCGVDRCGTCVPAFVFRKEGQRQTAPDAFRKTRKRGGENGTNRRNCRNRGRINQYITKTSGRLSRRFFLRYFICILEVPADNRRTPRSMRQVYTEPTQSVLAFRFPSNLCWRWTSQAPLRVCFALCPFQA